MQTVFRAPGRYVQKSGAMEELGGFVKLFGGKGLLVLTEGSLNRFGASLIEKAAGKEYTLSSCVIGRETTNHEIDKAVVACREGGCTVVIGLGGGKTLDTARAAADLCGAYLILVPTVASNDAPCSALSIIHDPDGKVTELRIMKRNPDVVLVDTSVLVHAPARLFVAGMGDALATWFEAEACSRSGAKTLAGAESSSIALTLARLCYETLLRYGNAALRACEAGIISDDFERVVQTCIFLSGIGFESGGVAGAHAINDGFSACAEASHLYHGEIVGFGTLCMLMLQKAPEDKIDEVSSFMKDIGLPLTFEQMGITPTENLLTRISEVACNQSVMSNMPFEVTPADVIRAMLKADLVGKARLAPAEEPEQ